MSEYTREVKNLGPLFLYLECKQVTVTDSRVRCRHICSLFLDIVALSIGALTIVVDQRVKAMVVK